MARGRKSSLRIVLSAMEHQTLERWQRSTTLAAGLVRRGRSFFSWLRGTRTPTWLRRLVSNARSCGNGPDGFWPSGWMASLTPLAVAPRAVFPPEVAIHVVRLACERPDLFGRSLSQWDCAELARQLIADGLGADISVATIRRILAAHQLKPWRHHLWLYPKHPRDAEFYATVADVIDLYTRLLRDDEIVLSLDEKTSLSRVRGWLQPDPLSRRTGPTGMSTSINAREPLTSLRPSIPVPAGSMDSVTNANGSRNASPS